MLVLAPLDRLPERLLERLAERLSGVLECEVRGIAPPLDPGPAFDPERRQYRSSVLLEVLRGSGRLPAGGRILGVLDADLFVPVLTFVFGEAELDGSAAVVSLTRLRPGFYGLPEDRELLFERLLKEALHELGHTFGLRHCRSPDCVMRASTSVGGVDLKPASFCASCAASLR